MTTPQPQSWKGRLSGILLILDCPISDTRGKSLALANLQLMASLADSCQALYDHLKLGVDKGVLDSSLDYKQAAIELLINTRVA